MHNLIVVVYSAGTATDRLLTRCPQTRYVIECWRMNFAYCSKTDQCAHRALSRCPRASRHEGAGGKVCRDRGTDRHAEGQRASAALDALHSWLGRTGYLD